MSLSLPERRYIRRFCRGAASQSVSSSGVSLAPAFLPAFLTPDFRLVGFFFEAAILAVVFFVARCVALPDAGFAAAFFVAVPFFFFFVLFFTDDFFAVGLLTAVARLAVFFFVRTAGRPRPAGADASSADESPMSMSMPKTDDSWSDASLLPLRDLPVGGG